jgi:hypothetical protein
MYYKLVLRVVRQISAIVLPPIRAFAAVSALMQLVHLPSSYVRL